MKRFFCFFLGGVSEDRHRHFGLLSDAGYLRERDTSPMWSPIKVFLFVQQRHRPSACDVFRGGRHFDTPGAHDKRNNALVETSDHSTQQLFLFCKEISSPVQVFYFWSFFFNFLGFTRWNRVLFFFAFHRLTVAGTLLRGHVRG
jgi:hypothetical protein